VANCSSVAGQDAFLGEAAEHRHIDYFQGLEQFWEPEAFFASYWPQSGTSLKTTLVSVNYRQKSGL
jgi:hypothetical protein